jgi:hypothetical protein
MALHMRLAKWIGFSSLGAVVGLVVVVGGFLVAGTILYSKAHPLNLLPYLPRMQAMVAPYGLHLNMTSAELYFDGSPVFHVQGLQVSGNQPNTPSLAVVADDVTVKLANHRLFLLQASPKTILADNVTLRVVNGPDGLTIAGLHTASGNSQGPGGLLEWLNGMGERSLWARMKNITISNLTLLMDDQIHHTSWVLEDGTLNLTRYPSDGEQGTITATVRRLNDAEPSDMVPLLIRFNHPAGAKAATITAKLGQTNLDTIADYLPRQMQDLLKAEGEVELGTRVLAGNRLDQPWVTLQLGKVSILPPKGYKKPIDFSKLDLTATYIPPVAGVSASDILFLRNVEATTARGNTFFISGTIAGLTADPMVMVEASSTKGDIQGIFDFFPDADPDFVEALRFVRPNISATYSNLTGHYFGKPSAFPNCGDACGDIGGFATINGGKVKFLPELSPAEFLTSGTFAWKGQGFTIMAPKARVGQQQAQNVVVEMSKLFAAGPTHLTVNGTLNGDLKPLMAELHNLDSQVPTGLAGPYQAGLSIHVPLIKDVSTTFATTTVQVSGTIKNASISGLDELKGDTFTAQTGMITLDAAKNLRVQATGNLNATKGAPAAGPLKADVSLNIQPGLVSPTRVALQGTFPGPSVWNHMGQPDEISLTGTLNGTAIILQKPDKTVQFTVQADAAKSRVTIPDLSVNKPVGEALLVETQGQLAANDTVTLESLKLTGPQTQVQGRVVFNPAKLDDIVAHFNPFRIGGSHAKVDIEKRKAILTGDTLNLAGLDFLKKDDSPSKLKNMLVTLDLANMPTHNGTFTKVAGVLNLDNGHWKARRFKAVLDGSSTIAIRTVELGGTKSKLMVHIDDLGRALNALGLYDKLTGGLLKGSLIYTDDTHATGTFRLTRFELKNPPILMRLLSLLSLQQLVAGSDGTLFEAAEIPVRIDGDIVNVNKAAMEGPSMSIQLNGQYDRAASDINLDGRLAPALVVNRLVGKIPLLGTVLTGSQDGVVVADFKLKGKSDDMDIHVRPLSVLTPGLVKDFWRGLTDVVEGGIAPEQTKKDNGK